MSTIIMSECWPLVGMSSTQKAVLISLADNANDEGFCWPSIKTISIRTCLSERAVQRAIKWLSNVGALSTNERNGRSTIYTLTPVAYAPPTLVRGVRKDETPVRKDTTPVNLAPRTVKNHKEPTRAPAFDFSSWPSEPDKSVWDDYKKLRQQKRATISQTVINRLGVELHKAKDMGFSVDDFLSECVLRGWQGGKAEWLSNAKQRGNQPINSISTDDHFAGAI